MADTLLTRDELATKLRRTVRWTYRHLPGLIRQRGFPPPCLPNTWSEAAVDAWIAQTSNLTGAPANDDTGRAGEAGEDPWAAALDQRAAQLAGHLAPGRSRTDRSH